MVAAKDLVVIAGILLAVGIFLFVVHFAANQIVTQMVGISQINESTAATAALQDIETSTNRFDYLFFGLFIAFVLSSIIVGYLVGGEPIFMIFYFLVGVIAVIASVIMSNVWYDASTASVFGTTVASFPIMNHILSNLPIYIAVIAVLGTVVMFSRPFIARGI